MTSTLTPAEERVAAVVAELAGRYPGALTTSLGGGMVQAVQVRQEDNAECWPRCEHPQLVRLTVLGPAQGAGAAAYLSAREVYWLVGELLGLLERISAEQGEVCRQSK